MVARDKKLYTLAKDEREKILKTLTPTQFKVLENYSIYEMRDRFHSKNIMAGTPWRFGGVKINLNYDLHNPSFDGNDLYCRCGRRVKFLFILESIGTNRVKKLSLGLNHFQQEANIPKTITNEINNHLNKVQDHRDEILVRYRRGERFQRRTFDEAIQLGVFLDGQHEVLLEVCQEFKDADFPLTNRYKKRLYNCVREAKKALRLQEVAERREAEQLEKNRKQKEQFLMDQERLITENALVTLNKEYIVAWIGRRVILCRKSDHSKTKVLKRKNFVLQVKQIKNDPQNEKIRLADVRTYKEYPHAKDSLAIWQEPLIRHLIQKDNQLPSLSEVAHLDEMMVSEGSEVTFTVISGRWQIMWFGKKVILYNHKREDVIQVSRKWFVKYFDAVKNPNKKKLQPSQISLLDVLTGTRRHFKKQEKPASVIVRSEIDFYKGNPEQNQINDYIRWSYLSQIKLEFLRFSVGYYLKDIKLSETNVLPEFIVQHGGMHQDITYDLDDIEKFLNPQGFKHVVIWTQRIMHKSQVLNHFDPSGKIIDLQEINSVKNIFDDLKRWNVKQFVTNDQKIEFIKCQNTKYDYEAWFTYANLIDLRILTEDQAVTLKDKIDELIRSEAIEASKIVDPEDEGDEKVTQAIDQLTSSPQTDPQFEKNQIQPEEPWLISLKEVIPSLNGVWKLTTVEHRKLVKETKLSFVNGSDGNILNCSLAELRTKGIIPIRDWYILSEGIQIHFEIPDQFPLWIRKRQMLVQKQTKPVNQALVSQITQQVSFSGQWRLVDVQLGQGFDDTILKLENGEDSEIIANTPRDLRLRGIILKSEWYQLFEVIQNLLQNREDDADQLISNENKTMPIAQSRAISENGQIIIDQQWYLVAWIGREVILYQKDDPHQVKVMGREELVSKFDKAVVDRNNELLSLEAVENYQAYKHAKQVDEFVDFPEVKKLIDQDNSLPPLATFKQFGATRFCEGDIATFDIIPGKWQVAWIGKKIILWQIGTSQMVGVTREWFIKHLAQVTNPSEDFSTKHQLSLIDLVKDKEIRHVVAREDIINEQLQKQITLLEQSTEAGNLQQMMDLRHLDYLKLLFLQYSTLYRVKKLKLGGPNDVPTILVTEGESSEDEEFTIQNLELCLTEQGFAKAIEALTTIFYQNQEFNKFVPNGKELEFPDNSQIIEAFNETEWQCQSVVYDDHGNYFLKCQKLGQNNQVWFTYKNLVELQIFSKTQAKKLATMVKDLIKQEAGKQFAELNRVDKYATELRKIVEPNKHWQLLRVELWAGFEDTWLTFKNAKTGKFVKGTLKELKTKGVIRKADWYLYSEGIQLLLKEPDKFNDWVDLQLKLKETSKNVEVIYDDKSEAVVEPVRPKLKNHYKFDETSRKTVAKQTLSRMITSLASARKMELAELITNDDNNLTWEVQSVRHLEGQGFLYELKSIETEQRQIFNLAQLIDQEIISTKTIVAIRDIEERLASLAEELKFDLRLAD